MKIAFYSPIKPPGHPVPSGDRLMARLLIRQAAEAIRERQEAKPRAKPRKPRVSA